jgi:DNA polymerase V
MTGAGIDDGDILVVDRSQQPRSVQIVIAAIDGEFTVKRLRIQGQRVMLVPENPAFPTRTLTQDEAGEFFGVVTWILKAAN